MNGSFKLIKVFNTDVSHLFQDFRDPKIMSQWSYLEDMDATKISSDFSVGKAYKVRTKLDKNTNISWSGIYNSIEPDAAIEFTWDDEDVKNSLVKINFEAVGDSKTRILLTHSNLPDARTVLEHKAIWVECLTHLAEHVDMAGNQNKQSKDYDDCGNYY